MRAVGEGLVKRFGDGGKRLQRAGGRAVEFGVLRSDVLRDAPGVGGLVEAVLLEADGERLHGPGALRLHQRGDGGTVYAAGEKHADGDVGGHSHANGVGDERLQLLGGVRVAGGEGISQSVPRRLPQAPVTAARLALVGADLDEAARLHLLDALEDGARRGDVTVAEVGGERVSVHLGAPGGVIEKTAGLRAEEERSADAPPVERLDADAVADEREAAGVVLPEGEREHAVQTLDGALDAPRLARLQHDLRVGRSAEAPARRLQLSPDAREVVDLAVVGDDGAPARGDHRLAPGGREVHHGEAADAHRGAGLLGRPRAGVVRAAALHAVGHSRDEPLERDGVHRARLSDEAYEAADDVFLGWGSSPLVGEAGVEPAASCVLNRRSNPELLARCLRV